MAKSHKIQEYYAQAIQCIETVLEYLEFGDQQSIDVEFVESKLDNASDYYAQAHPDDYRHSGGAELELLAEAAADNLSGESSEGMINVFIDQLYGVYRTITSQAEELSDDYQSSSFDETDEVSIDSTERSPVSKDYEAYVDAEKATEKRWERAVKSESLFFDIERSLKKTTQHLAEKFLGNRTRADGKPELIDITRHSKRAIIMADAGAVQRSVADVDWDDAKQKVATSSPKAKHTLLAKKLGWHNNGSAANWNWQHLYLGEAGAGKAITNKMVAKYQEKPSLNNVSNFILKGIGSYGKDILPFINTLTAKDPEYEMVLAKLLLKFSATKKVPTFAMLEKYDLELPGSMTAKRNSIIKFNKMALLIVVKEVSRRRHHGPDIPDYPFGIAIAKALLLLSDGHLRMEQVFDADAKYGVFTGTKIMDTNNLRALKGKFNRVFDLYDRKYSTITCNKEFLGAHPGAKIISTREVNHQISLAVYGGLSDSDNETYESSDEETCSLFAKTY